MSFFRELNLLAAEYSGALSITLIVLLLFAGGTLLALNSKLQRLIRRYNALMRGVDHGNLEALVEQHVALTREQGEQLTELAKAYERLEEKASHGLQRVGLVRFNAFDGVGGNQSFSLALLDEHGDGLVITSLFGRSESANYCKAVQKGEATLVPSSEEEEAIYAAMHGGISKERR